jgi:hypothetical protein
LPQPLGRAALQNETLPRQSARKVYTAARLYRTKHPGSKVCAAVGSRDFTNWNVIASNNAFGLVAGANAILRAAHSVVTGNSTGVATFTGGILNSYGDNDIDGNNNNNLAALTPLAMH